MCIGINSIHRNEFWLIQKSCKFHCQLVRFKKKEEQEGKNNESFKCIPVFFIFSYLRHKVLKEIRYLKIMCLQHEPVCERKGARFKYFQYFDCDSYCLFVLVKSKYRHNVHLCVHAYAIIYHHFVYSIYCISLYCINMYTIFQ